MKTLITIFSLSVISLFIHPVDETEAAQPEEINICNEEKEVVFQHGEKFILKVYYNWGALWLSAGEVQFKVSEKMLNEREVYHITASGQTYKSYEWFYKVRDVYESYVDKETFKPLRFVRDVDEGGFIIQDIYDFDHDKNQVHCQDLDENTESSFSIPNCIHDVVSAIYYARTINFDDFSPGDKIPVSVFIDDYTYEIYIRYLGKETLKTKNGKFQTIKMAPLLLDNEYFDGGEEMTLWVTDDENKIPVRIESPLSVGSIKADIHTVSGLKYDFKAVIKD